MAKGLEALTAVIGPEMTAVAEAVQAQAQAQTAPQKPLSRSDCLKTLKKVELALNKQFDTTQSLVRLGNKVGKPVPSIVTGMPTFDYEVLGCGGIPRGRIIEIFGPESSGKTTVTLEILACDQRAGNLAAFIDAEHALDPTYAAKLGVDVDNLIVSQPDCGEQALETVIALIESRAVGSIAVDSVAALVPRAELDGEMGDAHMGLHARMMSQAMRKMSGIAAKNGVPVIFINQIREKIGGYGNPETTTGGRALKFYSSVRLDVRRVSKANGGEITSGGVQIGHKVKIKGVKNKIGPPFRESIVDLIYGVGFDKEADLIQYAANCGVIEQAGAWYKFHGEQLGNGIDKSIATIKNDPKLLSAIHAEIQKARAAQQEAEK